MVGRLALNQKIGVRFPVPQPSRDRSSRTRRYRIIRMYKKKWFLKLIKEATRVLVTAAWFASLIGGILFFIGLPAR